MTPPEAAEGRRRGSIIPIGGAEEKERDPEILRKFARLCGGRDARIVVIPTASALKGRGGDYEDLFEKIGVKRTRTLNFKTRADCERADWLETLERATGVFLTGGNQLRLSTTLGGTPAAATLQKINTDGAHIAGTSAGAAFLPEHMIAFGEEGSTPRADMVTLAPGLGLTNRVLVDQHFRQRDRLGRLLTALAYNPFAVGVGLDEDTAAFIGPDDVLEVVGSGALTIVDPSEVEYSSMDSSQQHEPVSIIGVRLHVLVAGSTFDLQSRRAVPAPAVAE